MAMVKIYKDGKSLVVPRSAYEDMFKMNGWRLKKESKHEVKEKENALPSMEQQEETEDEEEQEQEDDEEEEYSFLHEKPVAEMTSKELKVYAKMLKVDVSGKSKSDVVKLLEKERRK